MSDLMVVDEKTVVDLGVADQVIAGLRGRLGNLDANTKEGYELVKSGISEVRKVRTGVEKSRKALKASALEYGRKVDAEAKRVTNLLLEIETPLKEKKKAVDDEIERKKREEELARLREMEERERKEREAREAAERAERERKEAERRAEQERIEKEQAAERARLEEERKKLEAERAEAERVRKAEEAKLRKEREALEAEKRKAEEDRRAKEEAERKAIEEKRQAELAEQRRQEEQARIEREKLEAEARRKEAERLMRERRPDSEKLVGLSDSVLAALKEELNFTTDWGREAHEKFVSSVTDHVTAFIETVPGLPG